MGMINKVVQTPPMNHQRQDLMANDMELSPTQPKSMEMTMDNNRRRRGSRINDEQKQYQLLSESNRNIKTIKDRERKPTRPPMSSKYNAFRMSQQKKQRDQSKQRE